MDSAMFDFLKDGEHQEKKYKSTNQIPFFFNSEDLFGCQNAQMSTAEETNAEPTKCEPFTPFFSIEEDWEMEDEMSQSDGLISEPGHESIESDKNIGFKCKYSLKSNFLLSKSSFQLFWAGPR